MYNVDMLQAPKGSHFETEMVNKKVFLTGVLTRLQNDVGTYLDFVVNRNNTTGVGVGFWGSVRLLMPVIEAVCNVYPQYKQKQADFLANELGVAAPGLVWTLFRHSLVHNDVIQHGNYNGTDASWGLSMMGQGHIIKHGHIGLDTLQLYNDLVAFLEREIAACNDTDEVEIIRGVIWSQPKQEIADDFTYLAK